MKNKITVLSLLLGILFFSGCSKEDEQNLTTQQGKTSGKIDSNNLNPEGLVPTAYLSTGGDDDDKPLGSVRIPDNFSDIPGYVSTIASSNDVQGFIGNYSFLVNPLPINNLFIKFPTVNNSYFANYYKFLVVVYHSSGYYVNQGRVLAYSNDKRVRDFNPTKISDIKPRVINGLTTYNTPPFGDIRLNPRTPCTIFTARTCRKTWRERGVGSVRVFFYPAKTPDATLLIHIKRKAPELARFFE